MLIEEQKELELHQCIPGHSEEISDIHTSLQRALQMTTWVFPVCSHVICLLLLVSDVQGIMSHEFFPSKQTEPTSLAGI
jgi:hypothetical protein